MQRSISYITFAASFAAWMRCFAAGYDIFGVGSCMETGCNVQQTTFCSRGDNTLIQVLFGWSWSVQSVSKTSGRVFFVQVISLIFHIQASQNQPCEMNAWNQLVQYWSEKQGQKTGSKTGSKTSQKQGQNLSFSGVYPQSVLFLMFMH